MRGSGWNRQGESHWGRALRLDNLALVPGSLLPHKSVYQRLANQLPAGAVLVVLPDDDSAERRMLQEAAARLKAKGHAIATLSVADVLAGRRRGRPAPVPAPSPAPPAAPPVPRPAPSAPRPTAAPPPAPPADVSAPTDTPLATVPPFTRELRLVRIDASAAPAQFEVLQWQPTLWGGDALVRLRGVVGQSARRAVVVEAGTADREAAVVRVVQRRLRAGFHIADWE